MSDYYDVWPNSKQILRFGSPHELPHEFDISPRGAYHTAYPLEAGRGRKWGTA
jgi:hypothetical protein